MTPRERRERITTTRRAGRVRRCHALHPTDYSIAEHCFNAVSLLFQLWPEPDDPPSRLVKSLLWHDCHEVFLGDLPATAKWASEELRVAYDKLAAEADEHFGWAFTLNEEEKRWLSAIDRLELLLWAVEQRAQCYPDAQEVIDALEGWYVRDRDKIPEPVRDYWERAA